MPSAAHVSSAANTEEVLAWAEEQLAADPLLRPAGLSGLIEGAFGVRVHPRSVERALARRRERHSKAAELTARETRKEDDPSLPNPLKS